MNSTSRATVAAALGLPVMLLLLIVILVGSDPSISCATPLAAGGAPDRSGQAAADMTGLADSQLRLARNGVAIGKQRGMPESAIVAELAAQATESTFRNLANPAVPESLNYTNDGLGYDHDSVGPHQMRASIHSSLGVAALMNPVVQINWFYDQVENLGPTAQRMSPAELAQAIERSAPNAYAEQLDLARRLYAMFADIDPASMPHHDAGTPPSGCGPGGTGLPLPADVSAFGRAVVDHADDWLGFPYVWGGGDTSGPTGGGFDCSGLTLYAIYHASGGRIRLPHYTQAQQDHPTAETVMFADRAPGDLIFFTAPGDSDSHHVGIYYGTDERGTDLLLHAPQTGQTVTLTPLNSWVGERMDVRRYSHPGLRTPDIGSPGGRA